MNTGQRIVEGYVMLFHESMALSLFGIVAATPVPVSSSVAPAASAPAEPAATALRADVISQGFSLTGVGLDVRRSLGSRFSADLAANVVNSLGGRGFLATAILRTVSTTGGRHTYGFGFGPSILVSPDGYGTVAFVMPDLSYEYAHPAGLSIFAGLGFPIAINESRVVSCPAFCFFETRQYEPWDVSVRLHGGIGYAF